MQQRVLDLSLRDEFTFENFLMGKNGQALSCLKNIVKGKEQYAYLYGPCGVGRTHLLQAACQAASQERKTALYLPLAEHAELSPHMLEGLERLQLVCVDDIHHVVGRREWEEALMHLYNRVKGQRRGLVIAGLDLPKNLGFQLPDLTSRLSWGLIFYLHHLTDEEKLSVLKMRAHHRGIHLPDHIGHFLLQHGSRNMTTLFQELALLEEATLVAKKTLTLPFVKEILQIRRNDGTS